MKRKFKGTVYAILTSKARIYIGSTMKDLKTRISSGIGYKNTNIELWNDMQKGKWFVKELYSVSGNNYKKIEKMISDKEFYLIIKCWNEYFTTHKEQDKPYNKSWGYRKCGKYGQDGKN